MKTKGAEGRSSGEQVIGARRCPAVCVTKAVQSVRRTSSYIRLNPAHRSRRRMNP